VDENCEMRASPNRALRIILWDIDGTLLQTEGAGRDAMGAAGLELQGSPFAMEKIATSGRLDPDIWRDIARAHGIEDADAHEGAFRTAYHGRLKLRLATGAPARSLPGAAELVAQLGKRSDFAQGLLTGNYPETGTLKLTSAGLALESFPIQAWGCDARRRPDLVPIALARAEALLGTRTDPAHVVVIGDTPRDVECAREHGCRSLAVGTGTFSTRALVDCGADEVRPDLSDVPGILAWLDA
jgi:phosphoglycolate phosphatase-like HAD superfamily hydrolase